MLPVPIGEYIIEIQYQQFSATTSLNVTSIGEVYSFSYESNLTELARFTSDGTYSVPSGVNHLCIYAIGGGAGGTGGDGGQSYQNMSGSGGRGGQNGQEIINKIFVVVPGQTISIRIGRGGSGGRGGRGGTDSHDYGRSGIAGGSTIIGDLVTLSGGLPDRGNPPGATTSSGGEGGNKGTTRHGYGYGGKGGHGGAKNGGNGTDGEYGGNGLVIIYSGISGT